MYVGERGKNRDRELMYVIMNICLNKPGLIHAIMETCYNRLIDWLIYVTMVYQCFKISIPVHSELNYMAGKNMHHLQMFLPGDFRRGIYKHMYIHSYITPGM